MVEGSRPHAKSQGRKRWRITSRQRAGLGCTLPVPTAGKKRPFSKLGREGCTLVLHPCQRGLCSLEGLHLDQALCCRLSFCLTRRWVGWSGVSVGRSWCWCEILETLLTRRVDVAAAAVTRLVTEAAVGLLSRPRSASMSPSPPLSSLCLARGLGS